MALTYEFIFRDASGGTAPTSTGPGGSGGQRPSTSPEPPQVPAATSPTPPADSPASVTPQQLSEAVQRAVDSAAKDGPQPPAPSESQQVATPDIPQQPPTQPKSPAGEATLDAIRDAASGKTSPIPAPQSSPSPQSQPQPAPSTPQPAPAPQAPSGTPTSQVIQQTIAQPGTQPQLPGGAHPAPAAGQPQPPPPAPQQPPIPGGGPNAQIQQQLQQIISGLGGAFGVQGAGQIAALAGATGPMATGLAGIGLAGLMANNYAQEVDTLANYSPEIARARAEGDVKEQMRLLEQARRFGDQDAERQRWWDNTERAAWNYSVNRWRELTSLEGLSNIANPLNAFGAVMDGIEFFREWNRQVAPVQSPIEKYLSQFDHVPDPPGFLGSTVFESDTYNAVIGL